MNTSLLKLPIPIIGIIITYLWIQDPGFLTWHLFVLIPILIFALHDMHDMLKARRVDSDDIETLEELDKAMDKLKSREVEE